MRRTLRPARPFLWIAIAVVVLSVGWVSVTALLAVRDLQAMRADLRELQATARDDSADQARLAVLAQRAGTHGSAASDRTDDLIWKVWSHAPFVGRQVTVLSGVSRAAGQVSQGAVTSAATAIRSLRAARSNDGTVDLHALAQQRDQLAAAVRVTDLATRTLAGLPRSGIAAVDRRRQAVAQQLRDLRTDAEALYTAASVGPTLLGGTGPRHYLVVVQNNGEARASGGIVGAYGILTLDHGRPTLGPFHADTDLRPLGHNAVDLGPEWRRRYDFLGQGRDWREVTATPDFPTAATEILGLWAGTHHGEKLDGVLSVDPVALRDVLQATGPLVDSHGVHLRAGTFVRYALADAYHLYPDKKHRTEALAKAAQAVFTAVVRGRGPSAALAERLGHAVLTRHLALYSAHADEQRMLTGTRVAQTLPIGSAPLLGIMTQEASGTKLAYYLRRRIDYAGQPVTRAVDLGRGPEPVQQAVVTITLTNTAPASGLPSYVAPGTDFATGLRWRPGTERIAVSCYLRRRGVLRGMTVDGKPIAVTSETEQGLTVLTTAVVLRPGETRTLVLAVTQPANAGAPLQLLEQPVAFPDSVHLS